jgi:hypothetical protein
MKKLIYLMAYNSNTNLKKISCFTNVCVCVFICHHKNFKGLTQLVERQVINSDIFSSNSVTTIKILGTLEDLFSRKLQDLIN